jgi:hypothetical protein
LLVHRLRCRRQRITVLEDRWTEAQAMAMMDSDTIRHRIFAAYRGAGLVFALLACALTQ